MFNRTFRKGVIIPSRLLNTSFIAKSFPTSVNNFTFSVRYFLTRNRKNNWKKQIEGDPKRNKGPVPKRIKETVWHLFDARQQPVGRIANRIAHLLMGKHKPTYFPNQDNGDVIVVVNTDHIFLNGSKWKTKVYRKHSGYPGGMNEIPAWMMKERWSDRIIKIAVIIIK